MEWNLCYTQSLQFGNAFWLFGATDKIVGSVQTDWKGAGKSYLF